MSASSSSDLSRAERALWSCLVIGLSWVAACTPSTGVDQEGLNEFARLCAGGDLDEAAELAEQLRSRAAADQDKRGPLDSLGLRVLGQGGLRRAGRLAKGLGLAEPSPRGRSEAVDDRLEARLRWTLGVARAQEGAVETAEEDFQAVRGSGDGELRQHGMYGLGWLDLDLAEELFETVPEVKGATQNAMSPGYQPPAPGGGEEGADPLPLARKAYESALEHYLERLRADWRDADTRANVEWIQRRLREIERIEEERTQDEGTDRSQEDPQEQDQQEEEEQSESSGDQGSPSDEEQEEEPQEESSEESDEEQEGEQQDSETENEEEPGEQDEEAEGEQDAEQQELHLTDEQMKRLLETLMQHNKEGEELREVMQSQGRQSTDRDW